MSDTPRRYFHALAELCGGYRLDPKALLQTQFDEGYHGIVALKGIAFSSLCEHHLLPFQGTADVAYIATGRVVGLSKLARVVDAISRRLQTQERMTEQIKDALETLPNKGVAVFVRSSHSCMVLRGVQKPGATMVTSRLTGQFEGDAKARAELMELLK